MVGLGLAVGFRDGLPLMSPPCRTSPSLASGLADGSDGGSGDGGLGLGGELLVSGLGLGVGVGAGHAWNLGGVTQV